MTAVRRRVYLMRHGDVAYFDADGQPLPPDDVPLTEAGRAQARAAAAALAGEQLDRVVTSGLRRTVETAALVAPGIQPETVPELRELRGGRLEDLAADHVEEAFVGFFHGAVPESRRFLGGELIGELLDRVNPAFDALVADTSWDTLLLVLHGGVNRAILSRALTGERVLLGGFEQAPGCVNVLDLAPGGWIVRAVNAAPSDPVHRAGRETTMELLWAQYRRE
jgi:broad specificity phosphatase PhoE